MLTGKGKLQALAGGVAIIGVLLALSVFIPIVGFAFALFIPLPVLFYQQKYGPQTAMVLVALVTALLSVGLGHIGADLFFLALLLLIGLTIGTAFDRSIPLEQIFMLVCGVTLGAGLLLLTAAGVMTGSGVTAMVNNYIALNLQMSIQIYEQLGISEESVTLIRDSLDKLQYVFLRLTPSLAICSVLFATWTTLLLSRLLFPAAGLPVVQMGPLNQWQAPEVLAWPVIACGVSLMMPWSGLKLVAINVLLVAAMIFFFQGMGIIAYMFEKKALPRLLRGILYGMVFVQQLLILLVILVGFFDIWINWRRLGTAGDDGGKMQ
jgi:uncharacterized protein YybS (DUF2232 family)